MATSPTAQSQAQPPRPNVVVILCDDLGYGDLGCTGHPTIATPNIDAFAASSLRMSAFYAAAPMCSPSRAGLLTGRVPHRSGIYDWIPHDGSSNVHLRREEFTLAHGLRAAGYQTALFGKWHLNSKFNSASQPQPDDHGFEHWFATQFNPPHHDPIGFVENGRALPQQKGDACQIVVGRAIDWLRQRNAKDQPFFQFVSFHEPHHPIVPPANLVDHYRAVAKNENEATYFASVHSIDLAVGRYLKALDELDLADDTLVLFTSDHGPQQRGPGVFRHSYGRSAPFRGSKRTLWDGGLRVPGFVRWPARIQPGELAQPIGAVDLLPTLAKLSGFALPDAPLDGENVSTAMLGDAAQRSAFRRTRALHWHFYAPLHGPQSVLREDRWTLTANWDVAAKSFRGGARRILRHEAAIRGASLRDFQLYDTAGDPKQTNNVAADHPEVVARLASQLRALHNEVSQEPKPWSKRTASQTQPNILFLVSEDNGPELGCYGDPYVQTPTLDKLAREGVRFERAFVPYSVCSPSRACFLTGLWPQQNGHLGLATHGFSLYRETASLPSWLGARGYRTGIIGKLHVNPERNFPWHFRAIRSANFGKRNMRAYASKAAEFVASSKAGQPWFLQINFPDAHFPLHRQQFGLPAKPLTGADVKPLPFVGADSPRLRELTADYYNCMSRLDSGVRMVLDTLSAEQREQTMVVYIGDHGAQFSRAKCSVYEAGLRVPMIVHWPNHMRAGTVREELVSTLDLVPTMLAAADVRAQPQLPGRSLLPMLTAKQDEPIAGWRQHMFGITTGSAPGIDFLQFSARGDRFKLVWTPEPGASNLFAVAYREHRNAHFLGGTTAEEIASASLAVQHAYSTFERPPEFELYDLQRDPHEFVNLANKSEFAKQQTALFAALAAWQQRIGDPLVDADVRKQFVAEQAARRDQSHRKKGFVWPYLERFRKLRRALR